MGTGTTIASVVQNTYWKNIVIRNDIEPVFEILLYLAYFNASFTFQLPEDWVTGFPGEDDLGIFDVVGFIGFDVPPIVLIDDISVDFMVSVAVIVVGSTVYIFSKNKDSKTYSTMIR